ncbi:hypothetical protein E0Z10_g10933 [Xylaria hypoxylon]|uniref:Uncharacterized protein n=1 Tax=Xylaria hypoxylon TaxID=37992 RepID=A0A4Z0YA97_9PEZI|nr:hypothetical protein E0Z10_g10933 [Xylaria hypoxylon]
MNVTGNSVTVEVPAGAAINGIGMVPGGASFSLSRGGATALQGTSPMKIFDHCPYGIYNFNPYSATVPAKEETNPYLKDTLRISMVFTLAHAGQLALRLPLRLPRSLIESFMLKQPQLLEEQWHLMEYRELVCFPIY